MPVLVTKRVHQGVVHGTGDEPLRLRTFANPGGRSLPIAPADIGQAGAHLARSLREGPPELVDALWSAVPAAAGRWLRRGAPRLRRSTSGLGARWLYTRLDARAKHTRSASR